MATLRAFRVCGTPRDDRLEQPAHGLGYTQLSFFHGGFI